jgi:GNAT superfamily N-acetyltransferase
MVRHPVPPTPPAPLAVVPVTSTDIPAILDIDRAAFVDGEFVRCLFADVKPEDARAMREKVFTDSLGKDGIWFVKAVRGNEVVGYAIWIPPKKSTEGESEPKVQNTMPPGARVEVAEDFYRQYHDWSSRYPHPFLGAPPSLSSCAWIIDQREATELRLLATDPRYMRQGVAAALMQWGVAKADQQRLPIRLVSTPGMTSTAQEP